MKYYPAAAPITLFPPPSVASRVSPFNPEGTAYRRKEVLVREPPAPAHTQSGLWFPVRLSLAQVIIIRCLWREENADFYDTPDLLYYTPAYSWLPTVRVFISQRFYLFYFRCFMCLHC